MVNEEQEVDPNMEAYYGDQDHDHEGLDLNLNPEMYEDYQDEGLIRVSQGYQYQQERQIYSLIDLRQ